MKVYREQIKNWFGFSRKERRSSFILLIIILIIISLRYIVPESNIGLKYVSTENPDTKNKPGIISDDKSPLIKPVFFDPNTASYGTFIKLGLDSKTANTIIKYRSKGGKFRNASDIKKIRGIQEEQVVKLIPFIEVAIDTSTKVNYNIRKQQRHLLDVNSCDSVALVRLPGIGPVLSGRIIKYRHLLGGFARIDQLKEVYGLPVETYEIIKERLFADTLEIKRINLNSAEYKEISRFPYFEKFEVAAILKYRELKGRIAGLTDLVDNKLINSDKAEKVRPYLRFE